MPCSENQRAGRKRRICNERKQSLKPSSEAAYSKYSRIFGSAFLVAKVEVNDVPRGIWSSEIRSSKRTFRRPTCRIKASLRQEICQNDLRDLQLRPPPFSVFSMFVLGSHKICLDGDGDVCVFFSFCFVFPGVFRLKFSKKGKNLQSLHLSSISFAGRVFGKGEADLRRAVACCQRSPFQEKEGTSRN